MYAAPLADGLFRARARIILVGWIKMSPILCQAR